jgi:hypothetical protein
VGEPSSGWVFRADFPSLCGATQKRPPSREPILAALGQGPKMDPRTVTQLVEWNGGERARVSEGE